MVIYVTGGSGSGKSAFAEDLIVASDHEKRCYIATMEVWDDQGVARVARHRKLRAGKGFTTFEYPHVAPISLEIGGAVLVEDLTNLAMNQWFGVDKTTAISQIQTWLKTLADQCDLLVIVGNELGCDGQDYDADMDAFLQALGALSCQVAGRAQKAYQVIAGLASPLTPREDVGVLTLIIGGKYQGKVAYAKALAGQSGATVVEDLAQWVHTQSSLECAMEEMNQRLRETPNLIIVCDEVGCGVVPMDKEARAWRERVGRVATALASQADVVIEMVCGIPRVIKERHG